MFLCSLYLSATTQTSLAQESYLYGAQGATMSMQVIVGALLTVFFYLPVTFYIKHVSLFVYFDRRFNNYVRKFVSTLFVFEAIQHSSISIFIPSVTFSQATGFPMFTIACVLALVCVLCTVAGGLKAVALSDSYQAIVTILCCVCLFLFGVQKTGGISQVISTVQKGYRLEFFNFDPSPYPRYTFWNTIIGMSTVSMVYNLTPTFHQRYIAVPTIQQANTVVLYGAFITCAVGLVSFLMGDVVYAYYAGCDPVLAGKGIKSHSMILPYFVSEAAQDIPGLAGLFYSGVMAAGLSTTTSLWNTVACTIYEDFIKPYYDKRGWPMADRTAYRILMGIVLIIAVISTSGVLVAQNFTTLFEASTSIKAFTNSAIFTLFHAGFFIPWVNSIGVVCGSVASALTSLTIVIGTTYYRKAGLLKDVPKILTTEFCRVNGTSVNSTIITIGSTGYGIRQEAADDIFWLFKISMCYYTLAGAIVGLVVAVIVSYATGFQRLDCLDPALIVPQLRWLIPTSTKVNDPDVTEGSHLQPEADRVLPVIDADELDNLREEEDKLIRSPSNKPKLYCSSE